MKLKRINYVWISLKIFVFISFLYTSMIMFRLQDINTAIQILFTIAFFLILGKIDSMDKRINLMEGK